jgi:hypothetical protein
MRKFAWLAMMCMASSTGSSLAQDADGGFGDDLFVIEGKVQKPAVVVEISRENLEKGFDLELRESFLDKVVEALNQAPF